MLADGCAVRHLPGGGKQPATAFEQVLAWNAALAQANDGFADNVIALQRSQIISLDAAKSILVKQATIAHADQQITAQISAAANCAQQAAGSAATSSDLDAAGVKCAQVSSSALKTEVDLITSTLSTLDQETLLGVKDQAKRQALTGLISTIGELITNIGSALSKQGVY